MCASWVEAIYKKVYNEQNFCKLPFFSISRFSFSSVSHSCVCSFFLRSLVICCINFHLTCDITLNINNYCSIRLFDEQRPVEWKKKSSQTLLQRLWKGHNRQRKYQQHKQNDDENNIILACVITSGVSVAYVYDSHWLYKELAAANFIEKFSFSISLLNKHRISNFVSHSISPSRV